MGEAIRAHDWSATSLGPPSLWSQSLKTAVRIMASSRFAMWMAWGPDLTFLCNDAYRPTLGTKRGWLGASSAKVWEEIWSDIGPRIDRVLTRGEATWDEGLRLFLERSGFREETYHTFSYSPLDDDDGRTAGMLCVVTEETGRVVGERRLRVLRDLGLRFADTRTEAEVWAALQACLASEGRDLPFALVYLFDQDVERATLACHCGIAAGHTAAPPVLTAASAWPLREAIIGEVRVAQLSSRFGLLPSGPWDQPPVAALMLPISAQGEARPIGTFIAALNPYRPLDADYRGFLDLLVGQIAAALANVNAYTAERERAEGLAQLDQAKTAFFSNISHEFRTPLTLMIGPLEDALAVPGTPSAQHELLTIAHRNSLRLLRLVNALLDFSRIEAGRTQATFRPVELGALTAEIAASFRATIEKAGLRYEVQCTPLIAPVYVDRDMWEKIVLNLLSNAFKFTFEGTISVRLYESDGSVHLLVSDTGTGIPEGDLPRLFERFHRVEGAKGRSFEGSGIGLALVQELVRSHGGGIAVQSSVGAGSSFSVRLPLGTAHLPVDRIAAPGSEEGPTSVRADCFVEEALRWLPIADDQPPMDLSAVVEDDMASPTRTGDIQRVLLADDNADLRGYIAGILIERGYEVHAVADGAAALAVLREGRPDMLISDVMMPKIDGMELLREVRSDPALRDLPVILLSARAGIEAQIEGFDAHADDYLTKPFSARELLARVRANIAMARVRREAADAIRAFDALQNSEARLRAIFETSYQLQGLLTPDGTLQHANTTLLAAIGSSRDSVVGGKFWDIPWFTRTVGMPEFVREAVSRSAAGVSVRREMSLSVEAGLRLYDFSMRPVHDESGVVASLVAEAVDITEQRRAEETLRQSQKIEALGQLTGGVAHDFNNLLMVISAGLELIDRRIDPAQRTRILTGMRQAVQRGSGLSRQLLAFSRRQSLRPEPVLLSHRIGSMRELLQRSLRGDIHVLTEFAPDLWTVEVDPGELELVILNLAVNSRDAMPAGGRIIISGRNAADVTEGNLRGDFVCLTVKDSGAGMSAEVMARAFEPFFTTKEVGKGSGLGLAQTHGFVRASGGFVHIESVVGSGTTISLYLPRSFKVPAQHSADETAVSAHGAARQGRVLLVEDDDEVAALTVDMLQQLGYESVRVASAEAALGALANGRPIDIVFSDVMMPGAMNGIALAREVRRRRPELSVLLTSGYSDSGWREAGVPDVEMLAKPYRLEELAHALTAAQREVP